MLNLPMPDEQFSGVFHYIPVAQFILHDKNQSYLPANQQALSLCQEGLKLFVRGEFTKAFSCFEQANHLNSDIGGISYAQAVCLVRMGQMDKAVHHLHQELGMPTSHPNASTLLADIQKWLTPSQQNVVTIFAIPKPFHGHIGIIQRNAIISWTLLQPRPEIILFGNEPGIAEIAQEFGLRHIPEIQRNEYGTPLLSDLFIQGQNQAAHDIVVYINADIILTKDFMPVVQKVSAQSENFLIIGQRWDVNIHTALDFSNPLWENQLRELTAHSGTLHPATGIDYFVFKKSLWPEIPPFAIGRTYWDCWLVYSALTTAYPVVDATQTLMVIHQNHDYSHLQGGEKEAWEGIEAQRNQSLANKKMAFISHATWQLTPSGLEQKNASLSFSQHTETSQNKTFSSQGSSSNDLTSVTQKIRFKQAPLKIIVGASGSIPPPGWTATEQKTLNLLNLSHWSQYFSPSSISIILAEHVWEHLTWEEGMIAAKNCYEYLAPGGYLRMAVPDGCHPHPQYIDWVKPQGKGPGAEDHKLLYTYQTFKEIFERAGFQVELLEYFDEQGNFHFKEWDILGGMIQRSQRFDERNQGGTLNYTSIILDARK